MKKSLFKRQKRELKYKKIKIIFLMKKSLFKVQKRELKNNNK